MDKFIEKLCRLCGELRPLKSYEQKAEKYSYSDKVNPKCRGLVFSNRAYLSILAEALSRGDLETGGVLFGRYNKGIWYVVEASDPGLDTIHTRVHHEMDDDYHNHIYPVVSRLYKHDLHLLGLWHRHPGSFDRFSRDDDETNTKFSEAIGNGTLSLLLNFDPKERLTCYYYDGDTGLYHNMPVFCGDEYFEGTEFLKLTSVKELWKNREKLIAEVR